MTSNAHELGASVGAWNAVVRRARIGRERKAAALVVSSYAHANGTGIHCGVARLAVDLEVSYSTAKRTLAWLRKVGLIELVRVGNRRRNLSDEYRLILGPDVLEKIDVLNPAEHQRLTDGLREANRSGDHGSSRVTPDQTKTAEDHGSSRVTPKDAITGQTGVDHGSPKDEPPSRLCTYPKDLSLLKTADDEDLGGRVTVEAIAHKPEEPSVVVEIFPGAAQEARYRPAPRWSTRSQDTLAEASAARAAAVAAHRASTATNTTEAS
ncbi:MAG: hypothetical protein JWO11_4481 [Nocardioides sp.]|nr:hypothetical protein [Nocardioides sp.]